MFKRILAAFIGSLAAIWMSVILIGVLSLLFFVAVVGAFGDFAGKQSPTKGSILQISLSGPFNDRQTAPTVSELLMDDIDGAQSFEGVLAAIDYAQKDKKIKGIFLDCQGSSMGYALREELVEALNNFKKSGKWIYAYGDSYTQGDYYVATVADRVYVNPAGSVDVRGLASQIPYFKGALDKLGVEMQIVKVGTFKSAVEPFILTESSEANVLQTRNFIDAIWNNISTTIAGNRDVTPATVNAWADSIIATYKGDHLKDLNVVSDVAYRRVFVNELKKKAGVDQDDDLPVVSPEDYLAGNVKARYNAVSGHFVDGRHIAVLYALGNIVDSGSEGIVGDKMVPEIIDLAEDDDVAGLVLRVNSGGGSAYASEQIWEALQYFKSKNKPLYVSMADYAASGGYYISCGADRIYADNNTLTGSIGIFGMIPCIKGLLNDKLGITFSTISTNPSADMGTITQPLTPVQRAALQRSVDDGYALFTGRVAEGRDLPIDSVLAIAEGRVWAGKKAMEIGLVDRIGSLETVINDMAAKTKLKPTDIVSYPRTTLSTLQQLLMSNGAVESKIKLPKTTFEAMSPAEARQCIRLLNTLTTMSPVQARMSPIILH